MLVNILFLLAAVFSEIVGTVAGFGSSTVFLPLAIMFFDFPTALTLVAFFHLFGGIDRVGLFHKGLKSKLLLSFGVPSVGATLAGALLVAITPQEILKGLLGLVLTGYGLLSLFRPSIQLQASRLTLLTGGLLSGFAAGLIGTGGAIRGAFLSAINTKKERYLATTAAIGIIVDVTRIPVYVFNGFLPAKFFWYLPFLFLLALTGSLIGKKIIDRLPQKQFISIVHLALVIVGIKFFIDWIR